MQDNNPPETNSTIKEWACDSSCHMRPVTFAVYNIARSVSANSGKMYCSAEYIAGRYEGMSETTVYKHLKILQAKGWLILTKERVWLSDGTTSTKQYRVLKHGDWVKANPGKCNQPVKKAKKRPSPVAGTGVQPPPEAGVTFTNSESHLHQQLVSSLKEPNLKIQISKGTSSIPKPVPVSGGGGNELEQQIGNPSHKMAQPSPETGTGDVRDTPTAPDVDALQDRFTSLRKKKDSPLGTFHGSAPTTAGQLALRLTGTLGTGSQTAIQGWESVLGRLLEKHAFADVEQAVFYMADFQPKFLMLPDGPTSGAQGFETNFVGILDKAQKERTVA